MPREESEPPVRLDNAFCKKKTDRALLVTIDGDDHWIPLSQVDVDSEVYDDDANREGTLVITHWFAEKRGFI